MVEDEDLDEDDIDDDEDDDDDEEGELTQGELLEQIDESLEIGVEDLLESDIKESEGIIVLELNDGTRWQLRLTRLP